MSSESMKAIVISSFGPVENLEIRTVPLPRPERGTARIRIRAFGVNHAEMHMRRGEWAESVPISGIECVGEIDSCPGDEFAEGTPVASVMGGLGRTIPGSYAEYTVARAENIAALADPGEELGLGWAQLAALPESYSTARTCLFRSLALTKGETLLIRGATSALGRAALNLAVNAGAVVCGHDVERIQIWRPKNPRRGRDGPRRPPPTLQAFPREEVGQGPRAGRELDRSRVPHPSKKGRPSVWPAGWAAWTPSATSTRCCR